MEPTDQTKLNLLIRFYEVHDPSKMNNVATLCTQNTVSWGEICHVLQQKYSATPDPAAAAAAVAEDREAASMAAAPPIKHQEVASPVKTVVSYEEHIPYYCPAPQTGQLEPVPPVPLGDLKTTLQSQTVVSPPLPPIEKTYVVEASSTTAGTEATQSPAASTNGAGLAPPPDGGITAWMVVVGAFLAQFVAVGGFYSFGVFMIEYAEAFGSSRADVALIGSVASIGFMGLAPIFSRAGDIYGCKRTIFLGGVITMAGWMVSGAAKELWHVFMGQGILFGFGAQLLFSASASVVSHWFAKRRGLATSLAVAGGGVGNIILPIIAAELFKAVGWRETLVIFGGAFMGLALLSTLFCRRRVPTVNERLFNPEFSLFRRRNFRIVAVNMMLFMFGFFIPLFHLPASAKDNGVSKEGQAFILSMIGVGNLVGRLTSGYVSDRIGTKRTAMLCQFLTGVVVAFWPLLHDRTSYAVAAGFFGVFACALWAQMPLLVAHCVGVRKLGCGIGMIMPCMLVGSIAGPPLAGWMYDKTGNYTSSTIFSCSFFLLSTIWLSQLGERPWSDADEKAAEAGRGGGKGWEPGRAK